MHTVGPWTGEGGVGKYKRGHTGGEVQGKVCRNKKRMHPFHAPLVVLGTVQYSSVQFSTFQYSSVQFSTVQYSSVQFTNNTVLLPVHPVHPKKRCTHPAFHSWRARVTMSFHSPHSTVKRLIRWGVPGVCAGYRTQMHRKRKTKHTENTKHKTHTHMPCQRWPPVGCTPREQQLVMPSPYMCGYNTCVGTIHVWVQYM